MQTAKLNTFAPSRPDIIKTTDPSLSQISQGFERGCSSLLVPGIQLQLHVMKRKLEHTSAALLDHVRVHSSTVHMRAFMWMGVVSAGGKNGKSFWCQQQNGQRIRQQELQKHQGNSY